MYCTTHLFKVSNETVFSMFTELCSHHHNQFQNYLVTPKGNLVPISSLPPVLSLPAPSNHESTLAYFGHFT